MTKTILVVLIGVNLFAGCTQDGQRNDNAGGETRTTDRKIDAAQCTTYQALAGAGLVEEFQASMSEDTTVGYEFGISGVLTVGHGYGIDNLSAASFAHIRAEKVTYNWELPEGAPMIELYAELNRSEVPTQRFEQVKSVFDAMVRAEETTRPGDHDDTTETTRTSPKGRLTCERLDASTWTSYRCTVSKVANVRIATAENCGS